MTIEGAIVQLKELIDNDGIPFWAKPSLQKIKETVEMEREQYIRTRQERKTAKRINRLSLSDCQCSACLHWIDICDKYCWQCGAELEVDE